MPNFAPGGAGGTRPAHRPEFSFAMDKPPQPKTMPVPMTDHAASTPRPTAEPPPLIFEWERESGARRRLAVWLLLVAAGHAALFYLFRVAPPLASRKPPPQHAILYLPPAESGVRALLSALSDRFPGAILRSEDHDLTADMAALARATPPSEPSWTTHHPELKPFPQPLVPQELPGLIQPGEPVLPDGMPPRALPPPAAGAPTLTLIVDEAPGSRSVVRQPAWPEKLIDDSWPPGGSVSFMLGVARNGQPEYCLPLSTVTGVDLEALRAPLMGIRFNESSAGHLQWITVALRW